MFAIRLLPPSELGGDGERLGQITVGRFSERFACYPIGDNSVRSMPARWRKELRRLVEGEEQAVALVYDPRFAWIIYRVGRRCCIQQKFSLNENFTDISPRRTHTDDGQLISEWYTTLAEITYYIEA